MTLAIGQDIKLFTGDWTDAAARRIFTQTGAAPCHPDAKNGGLTNQAFRDTFSPLNSARSL
jgi:hypothetical protein